MLTSNSIEMLINGIRRMKVKRNGIKMNLEKNGKKVTLFINKLTAFQQVKNKMICKELQKINLKIKIQIQKMSQIRPKILKNNQILKMK